MNKYTKKAGLVVTAILAALLGHIIVALSLFGPCYNGCTVTSFIESTLEQLPTSLVTLLLLICGVLLYMIALYLLSAVFITRLQVHRWIRILLSIAVTPISLLALYGLIFDFGDAVIYAPITLIAIVILALVWRSNIRKFLGYETLSN